MSLRLSGPASEELVEAVRWYEQQRPGLGSRFFDAISHTFDLIQTHPDVGVVRPGQVPSRQLVVAGFPYRIVYRVDEADISIVAVAHARRQPDYWKHRR